MNKNVYNLEKRCLYWNIVILVHLCLGVLYMIVINAPHCRWGGGGKLIIKSLFSGLIVVDYIYVSESNDAKQATLEVIHFEFGASK